jgi:type IV secretory pathway TraG/TraD family ATPase VirD4
VLTTAQEHTGFLDAPELRRVCERSDFSLEDFRDKKLSVYLCLPLNMVTGKEARWLRMFVVLFIDMMLMGRQAPKPPVLLAIDEFPSLGRLDGIENVAPTMRSYGVRFWAVAQDISQLKAVYPDCWSGFIGNAEAVQFMGVTHAATVDFISERLGKHLVEGRQDGRLVRMERPLLEAEQVGRLLWPGLKNQIVWRGSRRPMKLKVTPYYEYLPAWYYSPDPRYPEAAKRARFR